MTPASRLLCLFAAFIGSLFLRVPVSAQIAEVYFLDGPNHANTRLTATSGAPAGKLPILFVHGHNLDSDTDADNNYQKNWQNSLRGHPSFKQALLQNADLGIESYYIKFTDQTRSIDEDAAEIADAIDLILHRHDPEFDYPYNPSDNTHVKVVIIAYSKGTISARKYLKNLHPPPPQPEPRPGFRPVSEFIAISPPNHGLSAVLFDETEVLPLQQLHNGFRPGDFFGNGCGESFATDLPEADNYIENLNGHPTQDTSSLEMNEEYPGEAPGSRANTRDTPNGPVFNPPTDGILYVTIFASGNADSVGGDTASDDCQGRKLAKNMSPHAVNIDLPNIPGLLPAVVHENTVHVSRVICKALFAAAHHRAPPEEQTCGLADTDTDTVPTIPLPSRAAAMLTLDFSGSMSAPAPPHSSRAAALQDAVALFIHLWQAVSVPTDRLGVTYFRTNVDRFLPANSSDPPPLLSASGEDIITNVNLQGPHDLTAMGGGLNESLAVLDNLSVAADIRRVILFTDGMQNVSPLVQTSGTDLVINGQPTTFLNTLGIPIDTIGIGAAESFLALLRDISQKTNGRSWSTTDAVDLQHFFVESLINALKGFSPQLVAYRHGSLGSKGSTQDFVIENGPRKLVLEVSWKRGDSLDFSVAKDGVDVTGVGRFISSPTHKIFVIDLPAKGITARGNWQLRINGKAGTAYETAAIIDGERISYDASFDVQRPRSGDALDLVVRLTTHRQPIRGQANVKVVWKTPRVTLGDILANYKPKDPPGAEPGTSALERKILALSYDPRVREALQPRTQNEELKSNDKGEFRKQFRPKIPGVYSAMVTIEGEDAKLGKFSRTLTVTTVVGFANAKLKDRDVSVTETVIGDSRNVSVIVSPRDKNGHRMGPGLASNISFATNSGRRVGDIQDLGDGRYMVTLALARGEDPTINVAVAGGAPLTGRLSKLSRR